MRGILPPAPSWLTLTLPNRSFLVTPIPSGGLGLTAAHYALLVSVMFLCSMIWQFRFYPFIGPPNGTLSHLAM